MNIVKQHKIGTFEVTSGALRITDPCYDLDTWCAGTLTQAMNGSWNAYVLISDEGDWGKRVAVLVATHKSVGDDFPDIINHYGYRDLSGKWNRTDIDVGVDSGQAGIFDLEKFPGKDDEEKQEWYQECCNVTLSRVHHAGTIEGGVVSSSGIGDGSYRCYTLLNEASEVVGVLLDFYLLDSYEDHEDDYEDEEEYED